MVDVSVFYEIEDLCRVLKPGVEVSVLERVALQVYDLAERKSLNRDERLSYIGYYVSLKNEILEGYKRD